MGIDVSVLDFLLREKDAIRGRVLQLGRQGLHFLRDPAVRSAAERIAVAHGFNLTALLSPLDQYSEALFSRLGADETFSMDCSPFEGASYVHDLNDPIPLELHQQFDVVFDGGTIEHVFDVRQVFENVHNLLRIGGRFLSVNAANNQLGHGFYQFSPELFWRVLSPECGYGDVCVQTVEISHDPKPVNVPDPKLLGRRLETGKTAGCTYVLAAATKLCHVEQAKLQQSDYARAWAAKLDSTRPHNQ